LPACITKQLTEIGPQDQPVWWYIHAHQSESWYPVIMRRNVE